MKFIIFCLFRLNFALTEMGENVKMLPVSPMLARFLYLASKYRCSFEAVTVAAFCSVEDFVVPFESMDAQTKEEHNRFMRTFNTPEGDHLRLVQIFQVYKKQNSKNVRKVSFKLSTVTYFV
jgi:HrpA-like RNA helicase